MSCEEVDAECRDDRNRSSLSSIPSLALADACQALASATRTDELFRLLEQALGILCAPVRCDLWQRAGSRDFQLVAPQSHTRAGPPYRSPARDWEAAFAGHTAVSLVALPDAATPPVPAAGSAGAVPAVLALAVHAEASLAGAVILAAAPGAHLGEDVVASARILVRYASAILARLAGEAREREVTARLASLERRREHEQHWLQAVVESTRGVTSEWDLARMLEAIVLNARAHLGVDRAAIYRYLRDEDAVQLLVGIDETAGLDRSMRIEPLSGLGLPLRAVIARTVSSFHSADVTTCLQAAQRPPINSRGYVAVPLVARGAVIGVMTADNQLTDRDLPSALVPPLCLLADLASIALTHAWKQQEVLQAEAQKKQFYRDILFAVTNGKLRLCERDEIEHYWSWPSHARDVRQDEDVRGVREAVSAAGRAAGMPDDRIGDLCLCASEATTNALKHAGGGQVFVLAAPSVVRVRVQDHGTGIDQFHLPRATLMKGYSTRASMGLGFTLMHELADRLYLHTSENGTTLIVEMETEPVSEAAQLLDRIHIAD